MSASVVTSETAWVPQSDFVGHLGLLAEVEQELLGVTAGSKTRYVRLGNYLAEPRAAVGALPRSLTLRPLAPAWKPLRLARLALSGLCGNSQEVASSACLIEARPHWKQSGMFRSFYETPRTTIKLSLHSENGRKRMTREVRARQVVEEIGCVRTPKVLACRDTDSYLAVHEEWVVGRTFRRHRDTQTVCRVLLPQLGRHYQEYGLREVPLDQAMGAGFGSRVIEAAGLFRWPRRWVAKERFLAIVQQLSDAQLNLVTSFCHGDLGVGHVLFDDQGSPIVIDWDGGGEGPIAGDLAKLNRFLRPYSPALFGEAAALLGRWSSATTYSPQAQLWIGALRSAAMFQQRAAAHIRHGRTAVTVKQLYRVFRYAQWLLRQDTAGAMLAGCGDGRPKQRPMPLAAKCA